MIDGMDWQVLILGAVFTGIEDWQNLDGRWCLFRVLHYTQCERFDGSRL